MSDSVIRVENLGKKYIIGHEKQERYTALRDVMANSAKGLVKSLRRGKFREPDPSTEEFWALKDVSFEIKQGDRVGIIGRNGAGKSTLLKILSRITEPTEGRISIRGRVASLLEVGTGFHPELTGRENIFLNGAILGMGREEIRRKFDEIVAFAEVERFLDTPVKRYSSGMYVRLAFAVAAHLEPEILIVDEVLAVGDAQFQKKCLGKMNEVSNEGRTVLFVSHNMTAISALCDLGLFLNKGELLVQGGVQECIDKYLQFESSNSVSVWNGDEGDENIKLRRIKVTQAEGESNFMRTDKNTIIWIEYELSKNIPDLIIGAFILNIQGERLAYTRIDDCVNDLKSFSTKGIHRVQLIIPENTCAQGEFLLNIDMGIHNVKRVINRSVQISFLNISGLGQRYLTGKAMEDIFRPAWSWTLLNENNENFKSPWLLEK
jgi:lipopolysaccharide transport system ATP-binding protein